MWVFSTDSRLIDRPILCDKELGQAKQFQLADEIRAKLVDLGVALEDTPGGTVWKRRR